MAAMLMTALIVASGGAMGQDMINNTPDYIGAWNHAHIMRYRDRSEQPTGPSRSEIAEQQRESVERALAYRSVPQVTRRVNEAFADYLAGVRQPEASLPPLLRAVAQDNPAGSEFAQILARRFGADRSQIIATLERGDAQQELRRGFRQAGKSDRSLIDLHASFLMTSWVVANGRDSVRNPNQAFSGIQEQLIAQRADDADGRDAVLQEAAETMALMNVMINSAWFGGSARDKRVLQDGVVKMGRRLGMDYTRMGLTSTGFRAL
ncbi:hypothetical protein [Luteimonas sp. gir]|uniref:hypothetical protein n=1 Tax=Luteimonas sp. gir TaxID=3127960 RepID=UPI003075DFB9